MALKLTKWVHYSLDKQEREEEGRVRKIMRMKKTEAVMYRKREIAGGRRGRTKLALTSLCNSNRSRGEKCAEGLQAA